MTTEADPTNPSNGAIPLDSSVLSNFDLWLEKQNDSVKALVTSRISESMNEITSNRKERDVPKSQLRNLLIAKREECKSIERILKRS